MNKLLLLIFSTMFLVGCDPVQPGPDPEPQMQVVTVDKPILYCPVPPTLTSQRLVIEDLVIGDEKDPGRVAQYYNAAIQQLQSEIETRDRILKAYKEIQSGGSAMQPKDAEKIFKEMTTTISPTTK
jgi:hypothetical protein